MLRARSLAPILALSLAAFATTTPMLADDARQAQAELRVDDEGNNTVPILAGFGSFGTCAAHDKLISGREQAAIRAQGLPERVLELADELQKKTGKAVEFVIACYHEDAESLSFVSSLAPSRIYTGRLSHVYAEIARITWRHPDHELYLLGHSYGGWAAMRAAAELPESVNIAYLATLDSISPRECQSMQGYRLAQGVVWGHQATRGCTVAPEDLAAEYSQIKDRVGTWANFYQKTYSYLHSSPIGDASFNMLVHVPTVKNGEFVAHRDFVSDPRPWHFIRRETMRLSGVRGD